MDIAQWLAATTDRAPPDRELGDHIPPVTDHPQAKDGGRRAGRSYRRKRHRASSDSSLVVPNPTNHERGQAATRSVASEAVRPAESTDGGAGHSSRSPSIHAPPKTYERRARHKTRADRYEPKPKKRQENHARKKPSQKRRKSHRSGDGGRTAGLMQSFQLKNGPQNQRLTVGSW